MNDEKTRLVEEGNTIYEIDLECMQRKQVGKQKEKNTAAEKNA